MKTDEAPPPAEGRALKAIPVVLEEIDVLPVVLLEARGAHTVVSRVVPDMNALVGIVMDIHVLNDVVRCATRHVDAVPLVCDRVAVVMRLHVLDARAIDAGEPNPAFETGHLEVSDDGARRLLVQDNTAARPRTASTQRVPAPLQRDAPANRQAVFLARPEAADELVVLRNMVATPTHLPPTALTCVRRAYGPDDREGQ